MNNYVVYMHKNKINGKLYIGQTSQPPLKRWDNGRGYETCSKFYNAILKYGWDNFEHIIIKTNLTKDEADELEESLIELYQTRIDDFGYNIKAGGKNKSQSEETKRKIGEANKIALKGSHWSEEHKKLISKKFSGENNPFYGKKHTEATKQKISENRKGKCAGTEHPMYGKKHTEEDLKKMSENRKGKGGKKVICINTGEIFNCMMDAARWCGLKTSASIGQVCNRTGKQKTAGKHPVTGEKLYWKYYEKGEINN